MSRSSPRTHGISSPSSRDDASDTTRSGSGRRGGVFAVILAMTLATVVPAAAQDAPAPQPTPEPAQAVDLQSAPPAATPSEQPPAAAPAVGLIPELNPRPYGATAMDVSWSPPQDPGPVTEYRLFRDSQLIYKGSDLYARDSGLLASTRYDYRVEAWNGPNQVAQSRLVSAKTDSSDPFANGALIPEFEPSAIDGAGFQNVIAVSPLQPEKLLIGGDVAGINKSSNRGAQWYAGNEGLYKSEQLHIGDVEWSPTVRDKAYMCSSWLGKGGGFFVTTNAGQSWTLRSSVPGCHGGLTRVAGLPNPHPRSTGDLMAIDKDNGNVYLATFDKGVMRSTDDGKSWTTLGLSGKYIRALVLDPNDPNVVYAAAYNDGVYVTTTARTTGSFSKISGSTSTPEELAIVDSVLWIAAGPNGVFKGTGSGAKRTFSKATLPTNSTTQWYTVTGYKPAGAPAVLYVGNFKGPKVGNYYDNMSKSTDGGKTWTSITLDPSKINYVPWGSTKPWWLMASEPAFAIGKASFVASQITVDPVNPQTVYVAGRSGAWRSDDGGINWRPAVRGIGATITRSADVDSDGKSVFVALADYVLLESSDGGESFAKNKPPSGNVGYGVTVDRRPDKPVVWVAVGERDTNTQGDVWRNDDPLGGGEWVSEGLGAKVGEKRVLSVRLLAMPNNERILFATVDGGGLWRKENSGPWTKVSSEISSTAANNGATRRVVRLAVQPEGAIFSYDPVRGLYRSKDTGKTWTKIWNKPTSGSFEGFMIVDPENSGTLYISAGDSLYRLDGADNGAVGQGLTPVDLQVDRPGPVYVARDRSVWSVQQVVKDQPATLLRSTDRGASWERVDDPVWRGTVADATGFTIFPASDPEESKAFVTLDGTGMLVATIRREGKPGDLLAPTTVITSPKDGETYEDGQTVAVDGSAEDNVGVTGVDVVVYRYNDETYLQADGSFGKETSLLPATLGSPGGKSTTFSFTKQLPPGDYAATAQAYDAAGNRTNNLVIQNFAVLSNVVQSTPTVTVDVPAKGQELFSGSPIAMSGSAQDSVGVARVAVAVQRLSDKLWQQPDGTWGSYAKAQRDATLTGSTATTKAWTISTDLAPDEYGLQVIAYSTTGGESDVNRWRTFIVSAPDTTGPEASVTKPVKGEAIPAGSPAVVNGEATDNRGVQQVGVAIKRISDALWLQPDGTWGKFVLQPAALTAPGAPSTAYSFSVDLPPGDYGLQVRATDTSGNKGEAAAWVTFRVVVPDTEKPTVAVVLPATGQEFDAGPLWIVGTAADNVAVAGVDAAIKRSDGQWLQPDGSFGAGEAALPAQIGSSAGQSTNWYRVLNLPAGSYTLTATAIDAAGNRSTAAGPIDFRTR